MPPLSLPNRLEIVLSLLTLVICVVISLGVYGVFRANGVPVRPGYGWGTAAVLGYCVSRTAYSVWKRHREERRGAGRVDDRQKRKQVPE